MPPTGGIFNYFMEDYMIFIALAKNVQMKGRVRVMIWGMVIQTTTAAASDAKKSSQYKPVDFFEVSIVSKNLRQK